MAARKPLFMDQSDGFHQEMHPSDTTTFGGLTLGGDILMGGNKLTGLGPATAAGDAVSYGQGGPVMFSGLDLNGILDMSNYVIQNLAPGVLGTDAVNKNQLDNAVTGLAWADPVNVFNLIGNLGETALEALSPVLGDAYVVSVVDGDGTLNPGSVAGLAVGDIVEWDGTQWVRVEVGSGGYVAAGVRAILDGTDASVLTAPYAEGVQNDFIIEFDGTTLSGVSTGQTANGVAVLVQNTTHNSVFDNLGYTYEGSAPAGSWIQFTGAGQIDAGNGLYWTGNTLHVGAGLGIDVNADDVQIQLATDPGLQFAPTSGLMVKASDGISLDSNGVYVDLVDTNPGLEFVGATPNGELRVKVSASGALQLGSDGISLKIDDTPNTLDMDTDGLKVVGLPDQFYINNTQVGATVTAANLGTLTDGSDASSLHDHDSLYSALGHVHSHSSLTGIGPDDHHNRLHEITGALDHYVTGETPGYVLTITGTGSTFDWMQAPDASSAEKVQTADFAVNEAVALGDPVYWSTTANRVAKGDAAVNAKALVFGVAQEAEGVVGQTVPVVSLGVCSGVLTALGPTVGQQIWLAAGGGLSLTAPLANNRIIRVGYAINANDLWVDIFDYGRKAA